MPAIHPYRWEALAWWAYAAGSLALPRLVSVASAAFLPSAARKPRWNEMPGRPDLVWSGLVWRCGASDRQTDIPARTDEERVAVAAAEEEARRDLLAALHADWYILEELIGDEGDEGRKLSI